MKLFLKEGNVFKTDYFVVEFITLEEFYEKSTNVPKPIPSDFVCSLKLLMSI